MNWMETEIRIKVRKRNAVYIPKRIAKATGITEGADLIMTAGKNRITLEVVEDPVELAVNSKKRFRITFEELERASEEEQSRLENSA